LNPERGPGDRDVGVADFDGKVWALDNGVARTLGETKPWLWAKDVGNLWRSTGDISDKWESAKKSDGLGVVEILDLQDGLESYPGPGHWNDPDMLEASRQRHPRHDGRHTGHSDK
jgi:hypothetical protein